MKGLLVITEVPRGPPVSPRLCPIAPALTALLRARLCPPSQPGAPDHRATPLSSDGGSALAWQISRSRPT